MCNQRNEQIDSFALTCARRRSRPPLRKKAEREQPCGRSEELLRINWNGSSELSYTLSLPHTLNVNIYNRHSRSNRIIVIFDGQTRGAAQINNRP